jgi:hypothetical protein
LSEIPVPPGHTRVYRSVSEAEYWDIVENGRFRQGPNSLEGKWFADSLGGARSHGEALYPDGEFRLMEADVPDDAPTLFQLTNLDGRGPARYLELEDLEGIVPRKVESSR